MARRRQFGSIEKLPSGRFRVRYRTPDGRLHKAPMTFATKGEADRWLASTQTDLSRGSWTDPKAGTITLRDYAARWMSSRNLRPRTTDDYERLLRLYIVPSLGDYPISKLPSPLVREWHSGLVREQRGKTTANRAYKLLHAVMATATDDDVIPANPCKVRGLGREVAPERVPPTLPQTYAIADAIEPRFRALILLAAFSGLRWGELVALRRDRLDLAKGTIRVLDQYIERDGGRLELGPPKSDAGARTVTLPPSLLADLDVHLAAYVSPAPESLLFTTVKGTPLYRSNFGNGPFRRARAVAGVPDVRFHDLRHLAGTLAASTGASLKELMARLGHGSTRAALMYQHATADRDGAIAQALDSFVRQTPGPVEGTAVAPVVDLHSASS